MDLAHQQVAGSDPAVQGDAADAELFGEGLHFDPLAGDELSPGELESVERGRSGGRAGGELAGEDG